MAAKLFTMVYTERFLENLSNALQTTLPLYRLIYFSDGVWKQTAAYAYNSFRKKSLQEQEIRNISGL